jgi:hypothetical protein
MVRNPKGMPMDLILCGSVDIGHCEWLGAADSVTVFADNQDDHRRPVEDCPGDEAALVTLKTHSKAAKEPWHP